MENKLKTVIRPAQQDCLEEVWDIIFKIAEDWLKLPFSEFDIRFKNAIDISGLTDVDITDAVQINEVRQAKGLPEDPTKAGVYMKSQAPPPVPPDDPNNPKPGGEDVQT